MLGFAPLATLPLATASLLIAVPEQMSATGGITFSGIGNTGLRARMSATGGLTFGGSGFVTTWVYRSATGGLTFGGNPFLRVAGRDIVFSAIPQSFDFRADGADFDMTALPVSFDFRGVPE